MAWHYSSMNKSFSSICKKFPKVYMSVFNSICRDSGGSARDVSSFLYVCHRLKVLVCKVKFELCHISDHCQSV